MIFRLLALKKGLTVESFIVKRKLQSRIKHKVVLTLYADMSSRNGQEGRSYKVLPFFYQLLE